MKLQIQNHIKKKENEKPELNQCWKLLARAEY